MGSGAHTAVSGAGLGGCEEGFKPRREALIRGWGCCELEGKYIGTGMRPDEPLIPSLPRVSVLSATSKAANFWQA